MQEVAKNSGAQQDTRPSNKTEVLKQGNTEVGVTQNSRSVNISISENSEKSNTFFEKCQAFTILQKRRPFAS